MLGAQDVSLRMPHEGVDGPIDGPTGWIAEQWEVGWEMDGWEEGGEWIDA